MLNVLHLYVTNNVVQGLFFWSVKKYKLPNAFLRCKGTGPCGAIKNGVVISPDFSFQVLGLVQLSPEVLLAPLPSPVQPCSEVSHGPGQGALWDEWCECFAHVKGRKVFPLLAAFLSVSSLYIPWHAPRRAWIIVVGGFVLQEDEFLGWLMPRQSSLLAWSSPKFRITKGEGAIPSQLAWALPLPSSLGQDKAALLGRDLKFTIWSLSSEV